MKIRLWGSSREEDDILIKSLHSRAKKQNIVLDIEYVDVLSNAELAREAHVSLTPVIDRLEPPPLLRLIAIDGGAESAIEKLLS
jgi:hypothetical protein